MIPSTLLRMKRRRGEHYRRDFSTIVEIPIDPTFWKVYHLAISENYGIYFKEFIASSKPEVFEILGTPLLPLANC